MDESKTIQAKLTELKSEPRDLDDVIHRLSEDASSARLQIQRLKKRKLLIKDEITRLENQLIPDIIA